MVANLKPFNLGARLQKLTQRAVEKYGLKEEQLHMGHYVLEGLYGDQEYLAQVDAATNEKHTNLEVAALSSKLADAMRKSGMKIGDHVVIMGPNNVWISMPFYACHYNGYATCTADPSLPARELEILYSNVRPKMVFCSAASENMVRKVIEAINLKCRVVVFQGQYNLDVFIKEFNGTDKGFQPAVFDKKETSAWLVLTSGTTGIPKAAVMTHETLLLNMKDYWKTIPFVIERVFTSSSVQWLSSLLYFITTPVLGWTRIQTSAPVTVPNLRKIINQYKPQFMIFVPNVLRQFLEEEIDNCDMSGFGLIAIAGGAVDKELYLKLKEKTNAIIMVVYAMTETLGSPFLFTLNAPIGTLGVGHPSITYKLVDDDGNEVTGPNKIGELWCKGGRFLKEYLNNPEETANTLTPDGWLKTGDLMSRDENNFFFFHERKKLLIKYKGINIAPVEIENVIKKHPKVVEAVVVAIPDDELMERAIAAVMTHGGAEVEPREIFSLVNKELPVHKHLHGGLFFVNEFPLTPGGKIQRLGVKKQALQAERIMDPGSKISSIINKFNNMD